MLLLRAASPYIQMASVCYALRKPESWGYRFRQIPDFHVATRGFDKNGWGKLFAM